MLIYPASATEYLCNKVSIEDGLSLSRVNSIARDSRGFLWIGTEYGLNRYDLETIKHYYHDADDETSIPDNRVDELFVDKRGTLWVICEEGVAYYDDVADTFTRLMRTDGKLVDVQSIVQEENGVLMGGAGKFYYFDYDTGQTISLLPKGGTKRFYTAIHTWTPGRYAVAARWGGMWIMARKHSVMERMPNITDMEIAASAVDNDGNLWISPYGKGIAVYDRDGAPVRTLTTANSLLPNDIVLDIKEISGQMWIATDGSGIAIYDPKTKNFVQGETSHDLAALGPVRSISTDGNGNIFASTIRDGAAIIREATMRTFSHWGVNRWRAIAALVNDGDSVLWIGDDGNGVFRHRVGSHSFEQIPSTRGLKVTALAAMPGNRLLVGVYGHNPVVLDKATGQVTESDKSIADYLSHRENQSISMRMRQLPGGRITLISDRIAVFDPVAGKVTAAINGDRKRENAGTLIPFYSKDGRLLSLDKGSVSEFNVRTGVHKTLIEIPEGVVPLSGAYDGKETVYIGTHTGVLVANLRTMTFKPMDALGRRSVQSLAYDDGGNLWIGTINGLFLKPAGSESVTSFSVNEGVAANEFQPHAVAFAGGRLYMGGTTGLLSVDCAATIKMLSDKDLPDIHVADVTADGERVTDEVKDGHVTLKPGLTSLHISLIDNGPNPSRGQMFRYIIRNGHGEHVTETFRRAVDINFPEAGTDYELYVQTQHHDGTWTEPKLVLTASVSRHWWTSWWAITAMVIILGLLIWWLWRRRAGRQRGVVARRLTALNAKALEREVTFINDVNKALRAPLSRINAPVKLLLEDLHRDGRPTKLPERLDDIYTNTRTVRDTIDKVIDLDNGKRGHIDVSDLAAYDVNRAVREAIDRRSEYDNKNVKVNFEPGEETFNAIFSRARMATILRALLRNAATRSEVGGEINVTTARKDRLVRVSVTDYGQPMDDRGMAGLWMHYTADGTDGLELAYAKAIIESQGGRMDASSTDGLTVWFDYPLS